MPFGISLLKTVFTNFKAVFIPFLVCFGFLGSSKRLPPEVCSAEFSLWVPGPRGLLYHSYLQCPGVFSRSPVHMASWNKSGDLASVAWAHLHYPGLTPIPGLGDCLHKIYPERWKILSQEHSLHDLLYLMRVFSIVYISWVSLQKTNLELCGLGHQACLHCPRSCIVRTKL